MITEKKILIPLIHIGFPKTGTTWLQHEFFPFVKNIDFVRREAVSEILVKPNTFEWEKDFAHEYFLKREGKQIVICDEMLVGGMDAGFGNGAFIKEVGARLKDTFNQAQIILFIRNQHSMIASAYYQYVRTGGNYSINKFLRRRGMFRLFIQELSLFSFDFFKYDQVISYYKELFGENNVDVYLYEEFLENKCLFLNKFKQKYNFDVDIDSLNMDVKRNNRYRINLMRLAKLSNSFTHSNTLLKYYIMNVPKMYVVSHKIYQKLNKYRIFGKFPSDIKLLGKSNYDFISDFYKESNRNLIEKHGLESIKKYNYPL